MINVHISPWYDREDKADGGIRRVTEAMIEHLPKFGIQPVKDPGQAHIINNHGAMLIERPGIPLVNTNHGLYWSRQAWGDDFMEVNKLVFESMKRSVAITAPSNWVNTAIRRGAYFFPETIYHGIDGDKFLPPKEHSDYILWNKARADFVSNPDDIMKVSSFLLNRKFKTTIGRPTENVTVLGTIPHGEMKQVISEAGIYLATTRETFGIGVLEAMAYGVPIAGFNWGGTSEVIIQGETGYLAPPGDYKALAECIELCYANWERLSQNAIADVRERWCWEPRIEQYANIFKQVYAEYYEEKRPKVSVIVTAYKLDEFLPKCLDSVQEQTYKDFDCVVIDDANLESTKMIVGEYAKRDKRFRYLGTHHNRGLAGARNFGVENTRGFYVRHVDADDFLAPNALELEAVALDRDRGIDIAYGHIEVVRTDGSQVFENGTPLRSGWPGETFNWYYQMAHLNQLPSCVMARREVFVNSGGYRLRNYRNEDAEFWCRVTSFGFRAKKVTQAVTYYHRERHDSKGAQEWDREGKEPDWTAWFPWRIGGTDMESGLAALRKRGDAPRNAHLVPFGAQGSPGNGLHFWYVHDYAYPVVSIIVTVGPSHKKYLIDALDSIQAQDYPDWECIVVNDTPEDLPDNIAGAPWAKVVNMKGNKGTAAARNEGFKHSRGKYIIWMDADDYWLPWFLSKMVSFAEWNDGVIFSDLIRQDDEKTFKIMRYDDFHIERMSRSMQYPGSSILIPRNIVEAMISKFGGYDTKIVGMEDYMYQLSVHAMGFCAFHIPEPLFVYRMYSTTKREKDFDNIDEIQRYLDVHFPKLRSGEKEFCAGKDQTY